MSYFVLMAKHFALTPQQSLMYRWSDDADVLAATREMNRPDRPSRTDGHVSVPPEYHKPRPGGPNRLLTRGCALFDADIPLFDAAILLFDDRLLRGRCRVTCWNSRESVGGGDDATTSARLLTLSPF